VLYVPELRRNLLSVSALEDKGYAVLFQNEQVFMRSKGARPDTTISISAREGKVYMLQGKPVGGSKGILDHGSMSVAKDKEHEAPKGEQSSRTSNVGSQPSNGKRDLSPSSSVRRPCWYKMTLMDAQEQDEAPRSTLRKSKPSTKFLNFMAPICSVINSVTPSIQGAADQQGWRDASEHDDVCNIVGQRKNQFQVALREVPYFLKGSVDVCSIGLELPHQFCV